jgi:hypothetical protein
MSNHHQIIKVLMIDSCVLKGIAQWAVKILEEKACPLGWSGQISKCVL